MSEPAVFLERSGLVSVRVHPLVVISILEQYTRRDVVGDRPVRSVLGTLLGSISGGVLEVTNCFGVPCTERDGVLEINAHSAAKTLALHRQLSPSEIVVGWYSTCGEKDFVNESVVPIQDFYMKETQKAIYLAVDVSFKTPHVPLKAFFCPTSVLLFKCKIQQFQELPLSLVATDAERVGLNAMSLAVRDESSDALPNDTRTLLDAVSRLGSQLDAAVEFVDKVLKGDAPADPALGRKIAAALASIPKAAAGRTDAYIKSLQTAIQDALMIMHVAKVAVVRVAVTDKIKSNSGR